MRTYKKDSPLTLVVKKSDGSGEIVTLGHNVETGDPAIVGFDNIPWSATMTRKLVRGDLLVATVHAALGAYANRSLGIVSAADIRLKATSQKWMTLEDQCMIDPRISFEDGIALFDSFDQAYGLKG